MCIRDSSDPSPLAFARRMRERGYAGGFINVMNGIYLTTRLGMAATVYPQAAELLGRPPITMRQLSLIHILNNQEIESKVDALLAQMTPAEKIGQMTQPEMNLSLIHI